MAVDNSLYDATDDIWWAPDQPLASIRTSLNPARLEYFDQMIERQRLTASGLRVLDVGCGGGLLAEELARRGCLVTGIDQSARSIATARSHAALGGLPIAYDVGPGETLPYPDGAFDVVTCVDVLEHVEDVDAVIAEIARVLRPGGIFLYDTINRTNRSEFVMIRLAQDFPLTRWMPRDLHAADHFIVPAVLAATLERCGLSDLGTTGMKPTANPIRLIALMSAVHRGRITPEEFGRRSRMVLSPDTSILYIGHAQRTGSTVGAVPPVTDQATVREARPDEYQEIGAMVAASYRALGSEPEWYLDEVRDTARRSAGGVVLVATDGSGAIVGTITYLAALDGSAGPGARDGDAMIRALAVTTSARGHGVGRTLVDSVVARARTDGRQAIALYTRPSMTAAQRLYRSSGFERFSTGRLGGSTRDPAPGLSPIPRWPGRSCDVNPRHDARPRSRGSADTAACRGSTAIE